jgi:hypothetical protein
VIRRSVLLPGGALGAAAVVAGLTVALHGESEPTTAERPADVRPPRTEPAVTTAAESSGPVWPVAKVMRRIDGASVTVGGTRVRIRTATALCSGVGPSRQVGGEARWPAFDCTYTLFARGIDRDLEFRVDVVDRRRYRLGDFRWPGER